MVTVPQLKFLMLSTFYPPYNFGGDGIYIYRLGHELAKRGHKIDIVHCVDSYNLLEKHGPKGEYHHHENIKVHSLTSSLGFISPFVTQQTGYSFFKRKRIRALITENQYDVIHYHNISLIGLEALTFGEAIKLYTMHEHWLVCPMHILWKYGKEVCTRRHCIRCQLVGKRPVQWWRYTRFLEKTLAHVDRFIAPSLFTKRKHQELGLNRPMTCLPNFLPTLAHQPQSIEDMPFRRERSYFLFVGRLEKIKGVQKLIAAFHQYRACDLLIAGDGKYTFTLKDLAKGVPHVKFLGRLSYQKLQGLYQHACAVIVPSLCYEIFPLVTIEAFAQRTPVIVNNLGALPEIVRQSGGGMIYKTTTELIESMEKFRLNPQLRDEMGNEGYRTYRKYWTEEYHINQYYQIIQEIAESKNIHTPVIDTLL